MKINLILGLKNRINRLSHTSNINKGLMELKEILLENSYPIKLINKFLFNNPNNRIIDMNKTTEPNHQISQSQFTYTSLPYIPILTPKLTKVFANYPQIEVSTKNIKTLATLYTKTKTPIGIMENSNVVYKIPCQNCDKSYIGHTSRNLIGRLTSHKSDLRNNKNTCALVDHAISKNHSFNFNETTVLKHENQLNKREFLEMVCINKYQCVNKRTYINKLSNIYNYILAYDK
uniref:Uncharacterized protein LOC114348369 n=1 Tax=Diabrotica virgifera virgifera TaxID=50390 RepID=A0A6P7HGF2_DIAVI